MNTTRSIPAQVFAREQEPAHLAIRRIYVAPKLTEFGSVSTLTAGGSGGGVESGQGQTMGQRP